MTELRALRQFAGSFDPWWLHPDEGPGSDCTRQLLSELHRIEALEVYRRSCDKIFVRWYGDPRYNGFSTVGMQYPSPNIFDDNESFENLIREVLTTLHNKFVKNKPVPTVLTSGGSYRDWRDAEQRENWIRGVFEEDDVYELLAQAQFNSMIFGDGFVGVRDNWELGRPEAYIIPSFELHVDPAEGQDGRPRSLYRIPVWAKELLAARYPKFEEEVWKATPFFEELWNIRLWNSEARTINTVEAWHLPSSKKNADGRHVVSLTNVCLSNEEWDHDYFPIVRLPWNPRPFGFFSVGLIEDLIAPQRKINRTTQAIDEHLRILSSSWWALKRGSSVVKSHISNLIGRIIEYTGEPPSLQTPQPVSPDLWQSSDRTRDQLMRQAGVSGMAVQSMKPAGLNSGKALRVYADQEDQRYSNAYLAKERAVVDLANLYCKRAQAMYEEDPTRTNLSVKLSRRSRVEEIKWRDLDADSYRVRVLPASSLSTTLAGRIEDVEDLQALGLIKDDDQKRELLQVPDLKADSDLSLAPRNLVLKTLQDMLETGVPVTPEPYWPLQTCAQLGLQMLCQAELREYPEERLDLLRNWVQECNARLNPPAPPAPPQSPPGLPGPPMPEGPTSGAPVPSGPTVGAPP